jgi:hypothetical protein
MRRLHDAYGRKSDFYLAVLGPRVAQDIFDGLATPLTCDEDAGIEDKSHSEVSRGFRFRMMSSRSAANAASITGL